VGVKRHLEKKGGNTHSVVEEGYGAESTYYPGKGDFEGEREGVGLREAKIDDVTTLNEGKSSGDTRILRSRS